MLVAEVHGKRLEAAQGDEDYLTSAVFGHLRYVPPTHFWPALFARAIGSQAGGSLWRALSAGGASPTYSGLKVRFWERTEFGEPDLLLDFWGTPRPLTVAIEVKLRSHKHGSGETDQLGRYLGLLNILCPPNSGIDWAVIYLTPRDSSAEARASRESRPALAGRLFQLQWQDVAEVAAGAAGSSPEPSRTILADVAEFLKRAGLTYFRGWAKFPLGDIDARPAPFTQSKIPNPSPWRRSPDLTLIDSARRLLP